MKQQDPVNVQVCSLRDYLSVRDFLQSLTNISAASFKKYALKSRLLQRPVPAGTILTLPLDLLNHGQINPSYAGPGITIVSEDQDFLALEKPPQVHGHPHYYHDQSNCLSFLRQHRLLAPLQIAREQSERGMLFRLDHGTSGILVFAKTEKAFVQVRNNFSQMVHSKEYFAVVQGKIADHGRLRHYLGASGPRQRKRRVWDECSNGGCLPVNSQLAELSFQRQKYSEEMNLSLVKIILQTGHRHQIRAQLAHLGHPLLGDELYGGPASSRLFLHAHRYVIEFNGELRDFTSEVPQNFFLGLNCSLK